MGVDEDMMTAQLPRRYGYYLAKTGECKGDQVFAEEAKRMFLDLGVHGDAIGSYDGGSIWEAENSALVRRLILKDWFSDSKPPAVKDWAEWSHLVLT